GYALSKFYFHWQNFPDDPRGLYFTVCLTTVVWILITFITRPEKTDILQKFYQRIQPQGSWKPVRISLNLTQPRSTIPYLLLSWLSAIVMTYSALFLIGSIIFGDFKLAAILFTTGLIG